MKLTYVIECTPKGIYKITILGGAPYGHRVLSNAYIYVSEENVIILGNYNIECIGDCTIFLKSVQNQNNLVKKCF